MLRFVESKARDVIRHALDALDEVELHRVKDLLIDILEGKRVASPSEDWNDVPPLVVEAYCFAIELNRAADEFNALTRTPKADTERRMALERSLSSAVAALQNSDLGLIRSEVGTDATNVRRVQGRSSSSSSSSSSAPPKAKSKKPVRKR
jgi:hypothetical protein